MIYEDALDLDDVSLSILPTENQTSGSAIRYQLQSPRSYQFVYLLSSTRYQFFKKDKKPGKVQPQPHHQQHSGHFGTKIEFVFLSKKRRRNIFDKAKVVCFKVQRPKVQKVMMLGGFKA